MSDLEKIDTRSMEYRALMAGSALFALTAIHHVYGAIIYGTPWRLHAAASAALAEVTGVLQVVPAAVNAFYLGRLLLQRPRVPRHRIDLRPETSSR